MTDIPTEETRCDHVLRVWPEYFDALWSGKKRFEVRDATDRNFQEGDTLRLREYNPVTKVYSGCEIKVEVWYVTDCMSLGLLQRGVVVMSIGEFRYTGTRQ